MSNGLVGCFCSSRTDLGDFMMYIFPAGKGSEAETNRAPSQSRHVHVRSLRK